jgi:cytochrome c553
LTLSRQEAIDAKMNQIARQAMANLIERHVDALMALMTAVGEHLHDPDIAALDDHLAALSRLTKTLGASGL